MHHPIGSVGLARLAGLLGAVMLATGDPAPGARAQTAPPPVVNAAGLEIQLNPPDAVAVGASLAFKVTARQAGYLVLLDVNAEGSVTQLYPNVFSMKLANQPAPASGDPCASPSANTLSSFGLDAGANAKANLIQAGQSFALPGDRQGADYTFQACPPTGTGMVVAVLSDKPVQIVDLPDLPAASVGEEAGFERLVAALQALRLVSGDPGASPAAPRWSVVYRRYTIR